MIEAAGAFRFLCDADLSMPIENVLRFLPPRLEDFDVAIGSRETGESDVTEPTRRRRMGRVFNALVRWLVLPGIWLEAGEQTSTAVRTAVKKGSNWKRSFITWFALSHTPS